MSVRRKPPSAAVAATRCSSTTTTVAPAMARPSASSTRPERLSPPGTSETTTASTVQLTAHPQGCREGVTVRDGRAVTIRRDRGRAQGGIKTAGPARPSWDGPGFGAGLRARLGARSTLPRRACTSSIRARRRLRPLGEVLLATPGLIVLVAPPRLVARVAVAAPGFALCREQPLELVVPRIAGLRWVCHASLLVGRALRPLREGGRKQRARAGRARQVGRCYKDRRIGWSKHAAPPLSQSRALCGAPRTLDHVTAITMRLRVTYDLACSSRVAAVRARDIAFEQTVELPAASVSPDVGERIAGHVESVVSLGRGRSRAVISFDPATVCGDIPQLLNLLFGNISLKSGILIADIEWPPDLLTALGGPRFGIRGVRELAGVHDRPLLCAALKPLGLSPVQLAGVARGFARAGIDIIKDDHSLSDQPSAPFRERVARCQEAVAAANRETGGRALYFPNVTSAPLEMSERAVL